MKISISFFFANNLLSKPRCVSGRLLTNHIILDNDEANRIRRPRETTLG